MSAAPRCGAGASAASGAAAGALALAGIAALEIGLRWGSDPPVGAPLQDLSLLSLGGATFGALVGTLRPRIAQASPFFLTLCLAAAFHFWLRGAGTDALAGRALREAARGAAWAAAGGGAGLLLSALARGIPRPPPSPLRDLVVVGALALPAALTFLPAAPGPSPGRNLLLLTVDTLRADRLGFSGCPGPWTPHLDRLARRGTVHTRGVTPLPRTLPALCSLMTGLPPHGHGVRDNFHYALGAASLTLAEILRERGWATAAVNSTPVLAHGSGVFQGFDSANDRGDDWSRLGIVRGASRLLTLAAMRSGDRDDVVSRLAADWVRRRPRGKPYFLWVHWLAPHMPYEPAFPFDRILDPGYDGNHKHALRYGPIAKGEMTYRNPLSERERAHGVALYDGEVATSDRAVGKLLESMQAGGALENTIVVFSSDHGESLLEHGYFFNHGDFVYGPAADVPLVRAGPGSPAGAIDSAPVTLEDLHPWILSAAGVIPARESPGSDRPLFGESGLCRFPHLNDRLGFQLPREVVQRPGRVEDWTTRWEALSLRSRQRSVEAENWKLVRSPGEEKDRHELFDRAADPGERVNLAALHPERVAELSGMLEEWVREGERARSAADPRTLDEHLRKQMETLGYVGD